MLDMRHIFHTRICYKFGQKFCLYKNAKREKETVMIKQKSFFLQVHCLSAYCWRLSGVMGQYIGREKVGWAVILVKAKIKLELGTAEQETEQAQWHDRSA